MEFTIFVLVYSPQVKENMIFSIANLYMICLTRCQTTQDLGSSEIRKYRKMLNLGGEPIWPV